MICFHNAVRDVHACPSRWNILRRAYKKGGANPYVLCVESEKENRQGTVMKAAHGGTITMAMPVIP